MSDLPPPPSDLPPPPGQQPPEEGPFSGTYGATGAPGYGYAGSGPPVVYAGWWRRFGASLIDSILVGVPLVAVAAITDSDRGFGSGTGFDPFAGLLLNIIGFAVGSVYYGLLEGGPKGQTVGKQALSVRVVDADSLQPGVGAGRAVGRYFARILSQLPLYLGYLWMLWDPRKQTWHDKMTRTVVVRTDV